MKKRLLTVLLAVCLVLALGTVSALADDTLPAPVGDVITLEDNVTMQASAIQSALETLYTETDAIVIDLAQHTLTITQPDDTDGTGIRITQGKSLTIRNGSIVANEQANGSHSVLIPLADTSLIMENVNMTTNGTALYPAGDASNIEVRDCNITAGVYVVGTNASVADGELIYSCNVNISLVDSILSAVGYENNDGQTCTVMINVPGTLNIDNCTITGGTQAVLIRGGDATITDSNISIVNTYTGSDYDQYKEQNWGSGNSVPIGAIIVGNRGNTGSAYHYPASCDISGTTVSASGDETSLYVYQMDNTDDNREVTLKIDSGDFGKVEITDANVEKVASIGITGGTYDSNVSAYIQDGAALKQDEATGEIVPNPTVISVASVNGIGYNSLTNAIAAADDGDTITLVKDSKDNTSVELSDGCSITLDMNGFDAGFAQNANIKIYHGNLNITGSGMLYEEKPYYAPVMMYGSGESVADYSVVTVGPNVTLKGWAGLFIDCHDAHASQAYGIVANVYGTLESVKDTTGAGGHALYINGTIKATDGNVPHFILDGSTLITEDGNGMYLAGYAETEIKDSTITSSSEGSTGIEIRAGKLKISGDTVITGGSGEFTATPNGNGSTTSNVALAVVQHTTKLPLAVEIEDGIFIGGAAMFEQNAQKNDTAAIAKINIEVRGGEYRGQIYSENIDSFIHSGNFSEPVSEEYLSPTLTAELYSRSNPAAPYSYYPSVEYALEAAQPGDVVTDLSGVTTNIRHEVKFDNNGTVDTINVLDGATITFTAPTRSGYEFRGWRDGSGVLHKAGDVVTVDSDMTFTAVWSAINIPDTYDIEIADAANGSVDTSLSNASAGSTITITATPDSGYSVASVTVTGPDGRVDVTRVNATTYTFKMPAGDVSVRVTFTDSDALPFTDVSAGQWFYDAVAYVYTNGMMEGDSATTFNPDGTMTRAMFWAVLGRIDGATITGTNWADQARDWAMAEGVSDGTDPNGLVTREQMVTMLWRYAGEPESSASLSAYTDAESVSDWAETAMRWAIDEGIITGMTDTTLVPQGTATRAQCAAIFMRFDQM